MTPDLKVTGRFDDAFAEGAKPTLEKLVQEVRDVTVDMSEASGIDGAGLAALVYLHKKLASQGHKVRVVGASADLKGTFERFHLADLFFEGSPGMGGSALRSGFFGLSPDAYLAAGAAAKKSPAEGGPGGAAKRAIPVVPRFDRASHSVKVWLDGATAQGGELRGGDALKSYRRWARKIGQDVDPADFRKHLAAILGPGRIMPRTSGYIVRGLQLRATIERGKEQVAEVIRLPRGLFSVPSRRDAIAALCF
jgi:anti-anti-sigma regulatory factor